MTNAERLTQAKERLAQYILAETAITKHSQSYSIANRTLTRADIKFIQDQIDTLTLQCVKLSRGPGLATRRVVMRDL